MYDRPTYTTHIHDICRHKQQLLLKRMLLLLLLPLMMFLPRTLRRCSTRSVLPTPLPSRPLIDCPNSLPGTISSHGHDILTNYRTPFCTQLGLTLGLYWGLQIRKKSTLSLERKMRENQ